MTETVNVERDIAIAQALDEIGVLGSSDQDDVDDFVAELEQRGYRIEATRQAEADKAELVEALCKVCDDLQSEVGQSGIWQIFQNEVEPEGTIIDLLGEEYGREQLGKCIRLASAYALVAKHGGRDE